MAKFKISDICIGQNFTKHTEHNGQECEVLEVVETGCIFVCPHTMQFIRSAGVCYLVKWTDGLKVYVREFNLRKKPPKKEDLGSWDEIERVIGWSPAEVPAL